jgi:hypothetical protein
MDKLLGLLTDRGRKARMGVPEGVHRHTRGEVEIKPATNGTSLARSSACNIRME